MNVRHLMWKTEGRGAEKVVRIWGEEEELLLARMFRNHQ